MKDIQDFITGFKTFRSEFFGDDTTLYGDLRQGQHPRALVIACSDSRTDPAQVMQCAPTPPAKWPAY